MAKNELDQLFDDVEENEGVLSVPMYRVRDACGVQRLREHTLEQIKEKLSIKGLKHVPRSLPADQTSMVRLYMPSSVAGKFIEAALRPGPQGDDRLLELAQKGAADKLQQIQEILAG